MFYLVFRSRDFENWHQEHQYHLHCALHCRRSISNNTQTAYNTGLDLYIKFLLLLGETWSTSNLPPVSEKLLMRFATYCHEHKQLRYSTIKLYLCGVRFYYMKHGGINPMVNCGRQLGCLKSTLCALVHLLPCLF